MRRPSEKRCKIGADISNEKEDVEQEYDEHSKDDKDYSKDVEDEVVEEEEEEEEVNVKLMVEDDLIEHDEDQGGQSQEPRPKKPRFPHKKVIKFCATSQKEMNELKKLEAELQKKDPDKKFVKKALETTFLQRRRWIQEECPSVQEILSKYPIFKKSKYVRERFPMCILYARMCIIIMHAMEQCIHNYM